jgi:hypothetical protein
MISEKLIDQKIEELTGRILSTDGDILERFPIDVYVDAVKNPRQRRVYSYRSPLLLKLLGDMEAAYGSQAVIQYHKLGLMHLIKKSLPEIPNRNLPDSIMDLLMERLSTVIDELSGNPDQFYDYSKDLFIKDLCTCGLRLYPAGVELVEESRIQRRFLFTGGIKQFLAGFFFSIFRLGELQAQCYQIHMDMRNLKRFNFKGRNDCYILVAELLKNNPSVKAMVGESWFYDPQLRHVSPRLNYLHAYPVKYGAKIFRLGATESDVRLSTLKSENRRRLYEEGKYNPAHYMFIWPRKELIAWAETQKKEFELKFTRHELISKISEIEESLYQIDTQLLRNSPIEIYVEEIKSYQEFAHYRYMSPKLEELFQLISNKCGERALNLYHKLAICSFLRYSMDEIKTRKLPDSAMKLYKDWFERIFDDLSTLPDEFYDHTKDLYCKDLSICSLRTIPVGFMIDKTGFPRRMLISKNLGIFTSNMLYFLAKMGGFKPYYGIHVDMRYVKEYFSLEGWCRIYRNVAECLKLNPEIRGMVGESWFYDPQLDTVSPHLAHLRTIPEEYGGRVFRVGVTERATRLAKANSLRRTHLFNKGEYIPLSYGIIWPRKGMIRWYEENEV